MHDFVYSDGDISPLEEIGEEVELPCDYPTALELWTAWRNGHIMPHSGGYLDQPRWWRTVIRFISSRYTPVYEQHAAEERAKWERDRGRQDDEALGDLPIANGWDALNKWGG